jgi:hypothetical protein
MDRQQAFSIIRAIGAGIAHAHARNMVHADLKPHNVMVTSGGEVRILDFGASRPSARRANSGADFQSAVTPAYACCELLAGKPADPRDDLFALACVAYELLTGRHPFGRKSSIQARDASMRPLRPDGLTGRQWRNLRQGLAWRRTDRSISVTEWVERLTVMTVVPPQQAAEDAQRTIPATGWEAGGARRFAWWAVSFLVIAALTIVGQRRREPALAVPTVVATPNKTMAAPPVQPLTPPPPVERVRPASTTPTQAPAPQRPARVLQDPATQALKAAERPPGVISAVAYRVRAGEGFAEVSVRRSDPNSADTGFMWWTVAGSAVPGTDFVAQAPTQQGFSRGRRSSNLYVRLLPNADRTTARNFHVEIGKAYSDDSSSPVARATIVLSPQR